MEIGNDNIISGIKSVNNEYIAISSGAINYIGFDSINQVIGRNDYDLAEEVFSSSEIDTSLVAESFIEQDEYALRGETVFIFICVYVNSELRFSIIHKTPYIEHNKIVGSHFHEINLTNVNSHVIKSYLSNPEIKITDSTYAHLEINNILPGSRKYNFSRRELQCMNLLVKGLSAKGIALQLNISTRTVESYLNSVKAKLGVHKTTEIVARVLQEGLL